MPLRECIESHTELERDAWLYWLNEHWHEKSLTDFYLQRVAYEVRCTNPAYRKQRVKMEDLEVQFVKKPQVSQPADVQAFSKQAQARWFGMLGIKRE